MRIAQMTSGCDEDPEIKKKINQVCKYVEKKCLTFMAHNQQCFYVTELPSCRDGVSTVCDVALYILNFVLL